MKRLQTLPEHYLRFLLEPAEAQLSSYLAREGGELHKARWQGIAGITSGCTGSIGS